MPVSISIALWTSLALVVLSVTLGTVYCFLGAVTTWRDLKRLGSAVDGAALALGEAVANLGTRTAQLASGAPRLEAALARFRVSWRQHQVLRAAWQDVFEMFGAVYPRK